jgi:hypothetical protein
MNLRKTILEEHSKNQTMKIVRWVGKDKKRFAELVKLFLHDEYRVIQRAAWPLDYCVEAHPELVKPWIGKMINNLEKPGLHDAAIRNTFRFLQSYDVPEKYLGKLVNTAYRFMLKSDSPIAVKVFAMSTLANITKKEPGLRNELRDAVKELMKEGSGAIIARGKMILKQLDRI